MRNTNVIAKNPKHQKLVDRVVQWDIKYELADDQCNLASDNTECDYYEDDKLWQKWNRVCESTYDKYLTYLEELPLSEVKNVEKELSYN